MNARSLSSLSLVFVVLYVLLVVSSAIPIKLLDYDWLNRVTATLINGSSLPLLALFILGVGNLLYPENQLLDKRRKLFSGLAVVAVYGFLLLIPLHIFTGLLLQTTNSDQFRALDEAERQLNSYRQAANQATSVSELQTRLTKLSAPVLKPEILARTLPEVKVQLSSAFNQVAAQIAQQRKALTAENSWSTRGPQVLRIVIACLVLAFGFAAFAQPMPSGPLLIDSIEQKLGHFRSIKQQAAKQQAALEDLKKMKDNQRTIFLEAERAKKRNEAEMRKQRERMKRQADQRNKRKLWGR
jgi:hypothetical protein